MLGLNLSDSIPQFKIVRVVRVRLKNKGSQKSPGRKRQKYQAPVPEHKEHLMSTG